VDFGKDSKYLFPIKTPPFYVVHTWSRLSTILAGLNINEHQQVVDAAGEAIPGLYAAGNCGGTPGGQSDWLQVSLGESLGFAFNEGYVAGCHVTDALD
jgi:fumarate reductase flavoprotein subunit